MKKHHEQRIEEIDKDRAAAAFSDPKPVTPLPPGPPPSHKGRMIFMYTPDADIDPADVALLREAGFIPLRVLKFDAVKLLDPLLAQGDRSMVLKAALQAIQKQDRNYSNTADAKQLFGSILNGLLLAE